MTVVVTGAAGLVGGNLVRALLSEGRKVRALIHHDSRALEGLDVEIIEGDVRDLDSLRRAFRGADVVYHTAAIVSVLPSEGPSLEDTNIEGVNHIVQASLDEGVRRLVHFSSIQAFEQEPLHAPLDETRPYVSTDHPSRYDRSKAAGEREVRKGIEKGLDAIILNPTAIIGPFDFRPSYIGETVISMCEGRLPALVAGGSNWVDVRDVVELARKAEKQAPTGASYIISGHWLSLKDVSLHIEPLTGILSPRIVLPWRLAWLGALMSTWWAEHSHSQSLFTTDSLTAIRGNRHISHARATQEFSYKPRPFEATLKDTLNWFASNGMIDPLPQPMGTASRTSR